jgi:hypothetical protein
VTVLFTNGEKRSTEVLSGYKDFQTTLKQTISGAVSSVEDSYQDGEWAVNGTVDYELDGQNSFEFESFHLIAEVGADTVYDYDLIHETGGAIVQESLDEVLPGEEPTTDQTGDGQTDGITGATDEVTGAAEDRTDEVTGTAENLTIGIMDIPSVGAASDTVDNLQDAAENQTGTVMGTEADGITDGNPEEENAGDENADLTTQETAGSSETASATEDEAISGMHGTQTMEFTCPAAETDTVKIYLTAVTKEGITLKLTLFEGTLRSNTELRISDLMTYTPVLDYYDKNQVKY